MPFPLHLILHLSLSGHRGPSVPRRQVFGLQHLKAGLSEERETKRAANGESRVHSERPTKKAPFRKACQERTMDRPCFFPLHYGVFCCSVSRHNELVRSNSCCAQTAQADKCSTCRSSREDDKRRFRVCAAEGKCTFRKIQDHARKYR